jgi:DNA polymerase-3 subunit beta
MKFTVSSSKLLKHLQKAGGAIVSNPVIAILEDFKFTLRAGMLEIRGTDLQTSVSTEMEVSAEQDMTFVVPAKMLIDTLKATPDQPVEFHHDEDERQVTLSSSVGKYQMSTHPVDEFPDLPEEENTKEVSIPSGVLQQAFTKTIFATSNDEARLAMTGVYVQFEEGKLVFASTDAHKLVEYTYEHEGVNLDGTFILPKKSVNLLKGVLPNEGEVRMSFNTQHAFFEFLDTKVACRLLDAQYPDYKAVVPTSNPFELSINRMDFYNSLRRISIFANKTTHQVILNINEDSLTVSAKDLDYSNDATEQLACFYKGEPMRIGFNAKFLLEMVGVLESEEVILKLEQPSKAVLVIPSETAEGESLFMLIMPVMLHQN